MIVAPFLQQVAQQTLQYNPQQTIVVLPNRRAGLFLRKAIADLIDSPRFLPQILTIEEFFMKLSGLVKVEQVEQLFRLYESYKSLHEKPDNFDRFLTWAPTFLADCSEIDTNLIDADIFFNTLFADREIRNWNIGYDLTEMQKNYLAFWKQAKALYFDFTQSLLNDGRAYNGLAYRIAIDKLNQVFPKDKQVIFAGFNALNRAEEALFDYVYEHDLGQFLWDFDAYYVHDSENKAGMYVRERYQPKWTNDKALQSIDAKIGKQTEQIQVIEAPNNLSQCEIAAHLVGELAAKGQFNEKTAIVLADEQLLQPLLYQLPKSLGSYNITMGKAVSQFPIYHLFYDYFSLQQAVAHQSVKSGYPVSYIKPLLLSPFVKSLAGNACNQLHQYLIENNVSFLQLKDLDKVISTDNYLYQLLQPVDSVEKMVTFAHNTIEQLRVRLYDAEGGLVRQVLFEIKKILQQFTSFEVNLSVPIGLAAFQTLFKQVARSTRIPYEGEPLAGLQIMGVLETRCLDFDNIILLSANEGILPKGKSANSFIPFIYKKKFEIQTFQDKDAIYAYSIYRLLHTVNNVYFVYNGQPDVLGGGEVSRFVKQIEAEFSEKIEKSIPIKQVATSFADTDIQMDDYLIEKDETVVQEIWNYLEKEGLSPTSIRELVNAPLDFYFHRIAKIKEPKELEQDIELSTFGTIVHNTLEELYKPLIGVQLTQKNLADLESKIEQELMKQVHEVFRKGSIDKGKNYLYVEAARTLVKQAIAVDKERIKNRNIELMSVEEKLACNISLKINGKTLNLHLHGKADRMQKRDGKVEIIDYKTGSVDGKKLETSDYKGNSNIAKISENPDFEKFLQLLCYVAMAHEGKHKIPLEKIASAMQPLKSWDDGLSFINNNENFSITQDQYLDFIGQLQLILSRLLNPEFPFIPEEDDKRLKYSGYKPIYL